MSEAERAHALALLLLPFMRPMIPGPTPLHMVEKPAPGTGATLTDPWADSTSERRADGGDVLGRTPPPS